MISRAAQGSQSLSRPGRPMRACTGFSPVNWPTTTPASSSQNSTRITRPMRNRTHGSVRDRRLSNRPNTRTFQNR